jgi:hypothetical protein
MLTTFAKPEGAESGFSFKDKLFIPPSRKDIRRFPRETRILSELQAAQKEMGDLIEKIPEEKAAPLQKNEALQEERKLPSFSQKEIAFPGQARVLIIQVRGAIQKLASSSNLADPEAKLLRNEIKRLKPLLDSLVETVSKEKPAEIRKPLFRLALPLPQKKPMPNLIRASFSQVELREFRQAPPAQNQDPSLRKAQDPQILLSGKTSPSQVPFTPEMRKETRGKKKKEKKKNFWFRTDREDAEDPLP